MVWHCAEHGPDEGDDAVNAEQAAVLIAVSIVASGVLGIVLFITYGLWSGRIRKSPNTNRREKNLRHTMTLVSFAICALASAITIWIDRAIGTYCVIATAFFVIFIAPLRTLFVEFVLAGRMFHMMPLPPNREMIATSKKRTL